jgi:hypothetical protein
LLRNEVSTIFGIIFLSFCKAQPSPSLAQLA